MKLYSQSLVCIDWIIDYVAFLIFVVLFCICINYVTINDFEMNWKKLVAMEPLASGARPTKHVSIEFEIRWKFKTL